MNGNSNSAHWIAADSQQFVINFFLSQRSDDALHLLLRKSFTEVIAKLMFYSGSSAGVHLFANKMDSSIEIDFLFVGPKHEKYITDAARARHQRGSTCSDASFPLYKQLRETDEFRVTGFAKTIADLVRQCQIYLPCLMETQKWDAVLRQMGRRTDPQNEDAFVREDCNCTNLLAILFGDPSEQLMVGDLGLILLWRDAGEFSAPEVGKLQERLRPVVKLLSASIRRFLNVHYQATPNTYLPRYREPGQRAVAVMFADIRNFTPTTEVLRNFGMVDELMELMREYCKSMGDVITELGGRVQAFAGDGIMALFGEYMTTDSAAVRASVRAAILMCERFETIRTSFKGKKGIQRFLLNEYEPLEFSLGIGINFGPVIFDYFGPSNNRTFSPLGDHVNFAQRLESQAGRYDSQLKRVRSPILLSRPAWSFAGSPNEMTPVWLEFKGKPYTYEARECDPVRMKEFK